MAECCVVFSQSPFGNLTAFRIRHVLLLVTVLTSSAPGKWSSCLWSGITCVLIQFGVSYCRDVGSIMETRRHRIVFSSWWSLLYWWDDIFVIILMMWFYSWCEESFVSSSKSTDFIRWCHIDILNGFSICLPWYHVLCYLTVLYTHTYAFLLCILYVCVWLYHCFVRNDKIKLWNQSYYRKCENIFAFSYYFSTQNKQIGVFLHLSKIKSIYRGN